MRDFLYHAPDSVQEATALLAAHAESAVVLNGGTDIVIRLRDRIISPEHVVDIKRITGLREISCSHEQGLLIGACVTMNELGNHPCVQNHYPFLAEAALSVGSKQVRNRATCVGNLVNASPLADTATPLLACDAVLLCEGPSGKREIPLKDFFVFVRKTLLAKDELVTAIRVPYLDEVEGVFTKISRRSKVDLSTICGTVVRYDGGYRVAFGAVAPTPIRLPQTEELLNQHPLDQSVIEQAVALAKTEIAPIDDVRASRQYRLTTVGVALRRSLVQLSEGVNA